MVTKLRSSLLCRPRALKLKSKKAKLPLLSSSFMVNGQALLWSISSIKFFYGRLSNDFVDPMLKDDI